MKYDFKTEEKPNSEILLTITIPKESVNEEYKLSLTEIQKDIAIPGFRKGKVPIYILENKFKDAILAELTNRLIENTYKEVIEKIDKKPITYALPKIGEIKKINLNEDFCFNITYETYPEIKYCEYKNKEVMEDELIIDDNDVEDEFNRIIKEFAKVEQIETEIKENDIVFINYKVFEGDKEIYSKDREYINVGKDLDQYKIGKELIGLKKGDNKKFEKKYPKNEVEELANKKLKFDVTILEVKREVLPEITEEIIKKIDSNCSNISELKESIRKNLFNYGKNILKYKTIDLVLKELRESFTGEIPESMIDKQIELSMNRLKNSVGGNEKRVEILLKHQGMTKDNYKEKMRPEAIETIKEALILSDIVKKENIKVEEDEIKKQIEPYALMYKVDVDDLYNNMKLDGSLLFFEYEVEKKKSIDFIYNNLKIKKGKKITFKELMKNKGENE